MKKHLSVLMLHCRSVIYKVLGVFGVMAAAEALLTALAFKRFSGTLNGASLEGLIHGSGIVFAFGGAAVLISLILVSGAGGSSVGYGYTVERLRVSERAFFFWQSLSCFAVYALLMWFQLMLILAISAFYLRWPGGENPGNQTLFLAFYRSGFLHSLLPLENWIRWLRNAAMLLALALSAAHFGFRRRRGKLGIMIILVAAASAIMFCNGIEFTRDVLWAGSLLIVSAGIVADVILSSEGEGAGK